MNSTIGTNALEGNTVNSILLGGTLNVDATWSPGNGTYVVDNLSIATGATLTIEPGTVVKFARYGAMIMNGTLIADGEPGQEIYFTSINDDDVGGDTNGDGDTVSPAPGDWYDLDFYGDNPNNLLDNVVIRYGGAGATGGVYLNDTSLTLTDSTITNNGQYGIYGIGSSLTVTGNTISGHTTAAMLLDVYSLSNSTINSNTLNGNTLNDILIGGTLNENATWSPGYGTYVVGNLTVAGGATLTSVLSISLILHWLG